MNDRIREFAKILVKHVRDASITGRDNDLKETANSLVAKRWRAASNQKDSTAFMEMLIADSIDEAIFYVLNAIDSGVLQASFKGVISAKRAGENWADGTCLLGAKSILSSGAMTTSIPTDFG